MKTVCGVRALVALSVGLMLAGCGGGGGGGGSTPAGVTYAYVADYTTQSVSRYTVNPSSGTLTAVAESPPKVGGNPAGLAVTPDGRVAYETNLNNNTITEFAVNPETGALTQIGTQSGAGLFPPGENGIADITVSPNGKFAYAAAFYANAVSVYAIDPTSGLLTAVPGGVIGGTLSLTALALPSAVALSRDGRFAYVLNDQDSVLIQFSVDASSGLLTLVAGGMIVIGASPTRMAFSPDGRFAYITNDHPGTITQYAVNASTGALAVVGTQPSADGVPSAIAFSPISAFAYVANDASISEYSFNASTGALTLIPQNVTADPGSPAGLAFATVHP